MTINPKDVVLPEESDLNSIKEMTMFLLDLDRWSSNVSLYGRAIEAATTPADVISVLSRADTLSAINLMFPKMSRDDLSTALATAWVMSEAPNMDANMSKAQAVRLFKICNPEKMMDEEDLEAYKQLPDEVTVYRGLGTFNATNIKALSWTLDAEQAKWFANRFDFGQGNGKVYRATIKRKYIFAYFNERQEHEVIVDYNRLKNIELVAD